MNEPSRTVTSTPANSATYVKYLCKDCGRQFVLKPTNKTSGEKTKARIDKRLLERLPLAGIARVEGVSETWLQACVNDNYEAVEQQVQVTAKKGSSRRV